MATSIHRLAMAGLLLGIDKFILSLPEDSENEMSQGPFYPEISSTLKDEEKKRIEELKNLFKEERDIKRNSFIKPEKDFSISKHIEDIKENLSTDSFNKFFIDFSSAFSDSPYLPHCQLLSALSACGDYPYLLGGKIIYPSVLPPPSPFQGEIMAGRLAFMNIFSAILPLFEARTFSLPLSCIIKSSPCNFSALIPGPIALRGQECLNKLNKWFLNKRMGEPAFVWEAFGFPVEDAKDLDFLLLKLDTLLEQQKLNLFSTDLLEDGKHIFHIDFQDKLCPGCRKGISGEDGYLCPLCKKDINLSKKSSSPLFIDFSLLRDEGKSLYEIIEEGLEEKILTDSSSVNYEIPLFYPLLLEDTEERKKLCLNCKENQDICKTRETCSFKCMSYLSKGRKKLFSAEVEFFSPEISNISVLNDIYIKNFLMDFFFYLKSLNFTEKFCSPCENREICCGKLLCLSYSLISNNTICLIGAWDKILNILSILSSKTHPLIPVRGQVKLFKPEVSSISERDNKSGEKENFEKRDFIYILDTKVKWNKLKEVLLFSCFLKDSIEKNIIKKDIINTLSKCKYLIENYFNNNDMTGLKFLPVISCAIRDYEGEVKEKLLKLLELEKEKSILPFTKFIINYLNFSE